MLNGTIKLFHNDLPADIKIKGDIAVDTETMGLNIKRDRLCLVQIADEDGAIFLIKFDQGVKEAPYLNKVLSDSTRQKIFHFARFDVANLYYNLGISVNNIFCTKIASKLVRTYTEMHGLKDLCKEFLNVQISKQQQCSYWGRDELTKEQQTYAANDVIYLHDLRHELMKMLKREGRMNLAQSCFDFILARSILDVSGWDEIDIFAYAS